MVALSNPLLLQLQRFRFSWMIFGLSPGPVIGNWCLFSPATCRSSILYKMLVHLLLLCLTLSSVFDASAAAGCGCAMDRVISTNPNRIPSRIPELYCRAVGTSCGNTFSKVTSYYSRTKSLKLKVYFMQCYQLIDRMDVGYTDDTDRVVHRRNVTIRIGCTCKTVQLDLYGRRQVEILSDMFMIDPWIRPRQIQTSK